MNEEYWFSATECFVLGCGGELEIKETKDRKKLVCKECGSVSASIPKEKETANTLYLEEPW